MNKKIPLVKALLLAGIVAGITFGITWLCAGYLPVIRNNPQQAMIAKLKEIDSYVQKNFAGSLQETKLEDAVASGYLSALEDKYAAYYTPEQYEQQTQDLQGVRIGIGIECIRSESGEAQVRMVYPNSPAEQAGMQMGDLLLQIDGSSAREMDLSEVAAKLQGEEGSTVTVVFGRGADEITRTLTRQTIEIPSVYYRTQEQIGYIRITVFHESTVDQFLKALNLLIEQGVTGLIFDLRDNPGGILSSVTKILNALLPEGPIVSQTDPNGNTKVLAFSDAKEIALPMVAITNQSTASAAELFVAALKDYEKAKQVGVTTYGKGVLQTTYKLSDRSAIRITTGYFNPPRSANFNGIGVKPDWEVTLSETQQQKWLNNELTPDEDPQYQKAMDLLLKE